MLNPEENEMLQDLAKKQEIQTGKVNISALSKSTGHDRKTIRKYLSKPRDYPHQYRHLKQVNWIPSKVIWKVGSNNFLS